MVPKRERGNVNMNGYYNNNFGGYVQQGNAVYVINIAEILRAQTEGMIAAYQMGLQERLLNQQQNCINQEPINAVLQPVATGYYAVFNEDSCGIFVDVEKLSQSKKYGVNWTEQLFDNVQDAENYLRNEMTKINGLYANLLPKNFDTNWMYYAKNNFQRCTSY